MWDVEGAVPYVSGPNGPKISLTRNRVIYARERLPTENYKDTARHPIVA